MFSEAADASSITLDLGELDSRYADICTIYLSHQLLMVSQLLLSI